MRALLFCLVLWLHLHEAAALAAGAALAKALTKSRPVIVHLWDPSPHALEQYAIDDVSEACRKSGATAILVAPNLIESISKEQESCRGNFPGPVPVIADCALKDLLDAPDELCAGAKKLGAAAIGIRYYSGDWSEPGSVEDALITAIAAANDNGLESVMLGEFGADGSEGVDGAASMAARVGAAAALTTSVEEDGTPALGCWNGTPEEKQRLQDAGFEGLLLKNACRGNMALGAHIGMGRRRGHERGQWW
jgi:hypothetical protein